MVIYCYGDSNTWGYDPRPYIGNRYPEEIRWTAILGKLSGCRIVNDGMNGREIPRDSGADMLVERLRAFVDDEVHLLIMLGSNDLMCCPGGADAVAGRMDYFLDALLEHHAMQEVHTLLISPPRFRRGSWVETDHLVQQSGMLGAAFRLVAVKHGVGFLDAGETDIDVLSDGVHFSERGHREFASYVTSYFGLL